jgi:guanine deaminase
MTPKRILRGQLVDFPMEGQIRHEEKGALALGKDGRILWRGAFAKMKREWRELPTDDYGDHLIIPGFIDAHIHFPQYRLLAAPGKDLLDWLNRFTFPEEGRYASKAHAVKAADIFLDTLIAHGTTSALAFSSVHEGAADALFAAAHARGMALITGKTMMDRNAPEPVRDEAEAGGIASERLIKKWHGLGRLQYAITPRFAITSTPEQLAVSGALVKAHPDCFMQTHLSESHPEIETVKRLFPKAKDYTDVYDKFGLLGPKSFFAHGIHLSPRELARLAEAKSKVVHCPTSNTFLGSGLFHLTRTREAGVGAGLATDVGGGTSYSMLATMGEAYKVAMLNGIKLTAAHEFHMSTQGNAELLGLKDVGTLDAGKCADITVLDPEATPVLARRQALSTTLEDVLFSLMILGDDRAIRATYVHGKRLHHRKSK